MDAPSEIQRDARRIAKILRDGGYSYRQSKYLIKLAREDVGLSPSKSKGGSVDRLTAEEQDAFVDAAYERSGKRGLMMRLLLETGCRVGAFVTMRAEDIAFRELEIRIPEAKGGKARDVPILSSLARELRLYLGERRTGYVFPIAPRRALLEAPRAADCERGGAGGRDHQAGLPASPPAHHGAAPRGPGHAGEPPPKAARP